MSEDKPSPTETKTEETAPTEDKRHSNRVLEESDVKDTMQIALERAQETTASSLDALRKATERLLNETSAASDLVKRVSRPPPKE